MGLRTGHVIGVNLPIYPGVKIHRYPDLSLVVTGEFIYDQNFQKVCDGQISPDSVTGH